MKDSKTEKITTETEIEHKGIICETCALAHVCKFQKDMIQCLEDFKTTGYADIFTLMIDCKYRKVAMNTAI